MDRYHKQFEKGEWESMPVLLSDLFTPVAGGFDLSLSFGGFSGFLVRIYICFFLSLDVSVLKK